MPKFLAPIDLSDLELQNFRVQNKATVNVGQLSTVAGAMYYDTTTNGMKYYSADVGSEVPDTGAGWVGLVDTEDLSVYVDDVAVTKDMYHGGTDQAPTGSTILIADTANVPTALTIGASTFVGRRATGGIGALTLVAADVTDFDAAVDAAVGTADLSNNYVAKALFTADHTILVADTAGTPTAEVIAPSTFVGRVGAGNVTGMSVADAKITLAIVPADVLGLSDVITTVGAHGTSIGAIETAATTLAGRVSAIDTAVTGTVAVLTGRVDAIDTAVTGTVAVLTGRVTAAENVNTTQNGLLAGLRIDVDAAVVVNTTQTNAIAALVAADTAITNAYIAADTTLSNALTTAYQTADNALDARIFILESASTASDLIALTTRVDGHDTAIADLEAADVSIAAAYAAADIALSNALTTAFTDADTAVTNAASAANTALGTALTTAFTNADTAVTTAYVAADLALSSTLTSAYQAADTALGTSLTNAYIAADGVVTAAFIAADVAVTTAFGTADAAVTTAFQAADSALDLRIDALEGATTGSDLTALTTRVTAIDNLTTGTVFVLTGRVAAAEDVNTAQDAAIVALTAADIVHTDAIADVIADYIAADGVVTAAFGTADAAVTTAFQAADSALDLRIDTLEATSTAYIAADGVVTAAFIAADAAVTTAFGTADGVVTAAFIAADTVVTTAFGTADAAVTTAFQAADSAITSAYIAADTALSNAVVHNALFGANSIVKADGAGTPESMTVGASSFVGRGGTGDIAALTGAEAMAVLSGSAALTFSFGSQLVTSSATPAGDADLVNKAYVDSTTVAATTGLDFKNSSRAMSTTNINIASPGDTIGNVGVSGAFDLEAGDRPLVQDDRILLIGQTNTSQNGIWVWDSAVTSMVRAEDADADTEVSAGLYTYVEEGTNAATGWVLTTAGGTNPDGGINVGVDPMTFARFSGGYGTMVGTADRITVVGASINIAATYVGQASITTLGTVTTGTWNGTTIAVANGGTGATTVADAKTSLGFVGRAVATVGDGVATDVVVTHSLGTKDVIVQVREVGTDSVVEANVVHTSTNTVTVTFSVAPATASKRVVVIG